MNRASTGSVGPIIFLKRGLALYLSSFRKVIALSLAAALANGSAALLFDQGAESQWPFAGNTLAGLLCSLAAALLGLIIMRRLDAVARGQLPDLHAEFLVARAALLPFVLATIACGLMVVAGMLLLIVPGIYLAVVFGFYGWYLVLEKQGPIKALGASFQLVEGQWWYAFGRILLLAAVLVLAIVVALLPAFTLLDAQGNVPGLSPLASRVLVESLVNGVFQPLGMALGLVLFYDLKARKKEMQAAGEARPA